MARTCTMRRILYLSVLSYEKAKCHLSALDMHCFTFRSLQTRTISPIPLQRHSNSQLFLASNLCLLLPHLSLARDQRLLHFRLGILGETVVFSPGLRSSRLRSISSASFPFALGLAKVLISGPGRDPAA